ncbi:succinylglutamate desuccinylase [Rheinheimera salexigens]|uniref:Succinylglutamate desuccinylase n=1 Tax=Rheinheimera salexigens TaxID=1628148 RepID=A0A1E7Q6W3_9GAMM|nr:succinylglutamate desuccinylase [Rheinheimera salexigens]OEY69788.1 succinylglutamate desuccinylase [Rheinheimera salexigens]
MVENVIPGYDFLALSLANPTTLAAQKFTLANQTEVEICDTGIIRFQPAETTSVKDIVLSCGIHGNETAPIEICAELVSDVLQGKLILKHRLLVIFGNLPAMLVGKREIDENLNRLFSGHHSLGDGVMNAERHRAKKIEHYVSQFYHATANTNSPRQRMLYDLHTAIRGSRFEKFAVYPFLHGKPWHKAQFEFLQACDVTTVLLMQTPASTFSYYASNTHSADSFTIELGKVQPFGQNDMERFSKVRQTLRDLVSLAQLDTQPFIESDFALYQVSRAINKQTEAFQLHFASDVENFTTYALGTLLATDGDIEHRVEQEGEAIIFPNANVAIGQRAMLLVEPTTVSQHLV